MIHTLMAEGTRCINRMPLELLSVLYTPCRPHPTNLSEPVLYNIIYTMHFFHTNLKLINS